MAGDIDVEGGSDVIHNDLGGGGVIKGYISLGDGADKFYGGDYREVVYGQNDIDTMFGNNGDDWLDGGAGKDKLSGGLGKDEFVFTAALVAGNVDTISDFNHLDDTFDIDNAVFIKLRAGDLAASAFQQIKNGTSTTGVGQLDRILYDKAHGDIYFDRDGSKDGYDRILFAHVQDRATIDHTDFHVM